MDHSGRDILWRRIILHELFRIIIISSMSDRRHLQIDEISNRGVKLQALPHFPTDRPTVENDSAKACFKRPA